MRVEVIAMAPTWLCLFFLAISGSLAARTFKCNDGKCTKEFTDDTSSAVSIEECKVTCLPYGGLWPAPTGEIDLSKELVTVAANSATFSSTPNASVAKKKKIAELREPFIANFGKRIARVDDTYVFNLTVDYEDESITDFAYGVDESYSIDMAPNLSAEVRTLDVKIVGKNIIGVLRGIETVPQLIVYDDLRRRYRTVKSAKITDKPVYQHRGVHIDTARSYIPVNTITDLIKGMSRNKLNSLHWHMTDTHSFPYVSDAYPVLATEGAYTSEKVYTAADIEFVVEVARKLGIRVTPELDQPAHVGEGFIALDPELITCFRWEPWGKYCVEPPCGQFNPTVNRVYDVLSAIYQEWAKLFKSDLFHMGGDEVNLNCWNSTESITKWMTVNKIPLTENGLHTIWEIYQNKSYEKLKAASPNITPIMWTSTLTNHENVTQILNPSEYIIQIWTTKGSQEIAALVKQKYKLIFTNYDELYMDCGNGAWIGGPGQNWCSPYVGWQSVYGHDPIDIVKRLGIEVTEEIAERLLGSESALWTEQVDEHTLEPRLWPRVAALAERLWTRPSWSWADVQYRMNHHRQRLVNAGLKAELLQPEWCYQNDGHCGTGV